MKGYYDDIFPVIVYEKNNEETKVCGISKFGLMYLTLKDDTAKIDGNNEGLKIKYSISGEYSMQPSAYVEVLKLMKSLCENEKNNIEESIKQLDFLIELVKKYKKY